MLLDDMVYSELMKLKNSILKYEKIVGEPVVAIKLFVDFEDVDGLYKNIDDRYFYLLSTALNRLVVCFTIYSPDSKLPHEFMVQKDFDKFKKNISLKQKRR